MKENIEIAEKFGAALRNAFDEKPNGTNLFEFASKHLSFSVTSVFRSNGMKKSPD